MNGLITWRIAILGMLMPFVVSMMMVWVIHPVIVRVALMKDIVDKPCYRKLQRKPVPVLGGMAVYFGIVVGAGVVSVFFDSFALFTCIVALTMMLYVGLMDDILGLSPVVRLVLEVAMIAFVVKMDLTNMNDMHGIFGIGKLPVYLSLPLSAIAGCGIINSINLIDGVDGLSSGFCTMACIVFGIVFACSFDGTMAIMAFLAAGALVPFFLHNVFGVKTKMFIGDAGTLMLGMLMVIFCLHAIDNTSKVQAQFTNMSVVAFCLSVLSIPVFDTLRVMTARMIKGVSPFEPDKSHLHHLFIEMGFSHAGTTFMECSLGCVNMLVWLVAYQLGGSATVQFVVVVLLGLMTTCGVYYTVRRLNRNRLPYRTLRWLARKSHVEHGKLYLWIRDFLDRH
ncbi:glycosyltransferase family 4 protein [Prevotella sp. kh1p2]|uniref:glycosyltransferase family 4 protein n=1 Tax=Prevotella sp. kh1p2 TaxID=1761883 RepID=UPI0008D10A7B|nr:MraY family glycosyltransferase [Prevotella sp. kh1p2]SET11714.1 UDP-N-acetylmuramyl pentapeptide phosphotransferase/UDP-N-acetylglucosamine-1-phosphate transferase [Prevotella sp. kh1p2]SNU11795.1 UDP-N-acetylmuramyl pentapeptide phosphotransferase/UDP-N-acetylglucosamine-1-phosphate transferase [Prevotellaceae bacterium KH2P17]